ncbi:MAG: hypothetical protein M1330_03495, partial [Armatimonadetes bacterium]|nr:hypothetical protein [Armatimonadota bacterium]
MMYTQDYDETYFWNPYPGNVPGTNQCLYYFPDMLYPYVKNAGLFKCPDYPGQPGWLFSYSSFCPSPNLPPVAGGGNSNLGEYQCGYGLNELLLAGAATGAPISLAEVQQPASIGMISDSDWEWNTFIGYCVGQAGVWHRYWLSSEGGNSGWFYGDPRHFNGINVIFADGHAKFSGPRVVTGESSVFWGYYNVLIDPREPSGGFTNNACSP